MRRTGLVGVVSVAGVARGRAVRRHAWFRRRLDSSRVSESGWRTMKTRNQCLLSAAEQLEAERQKSSAVAVGEEAEVADAYEAGW